MERGTGWEDFETQNRISLSHPCSIPGHNPLSTKKLSQRKGYVLAIFRDPRRRLLSAYNYHKHSFGLNSWVARRDGIASNLSVYLFATCPPSLERQRMINITHTLEAFANFPGIASCQAKMVLGFTCANHVHLFPDDMAEAKRRVTQDFALVGILEHWNASVCLFHRRLGRRVGGAGAEKGHKSPIVSCRQVWRQYAPQRAGQL